MRAVFFFKLIEQNELNENINDSKTIKGFSPDTRSLVVLTLDESDGKFVLGVNFFSQDKKLLSSKQFLTDFFYTSQKNCCLELKTKNLWSFLVQLWGLKIVILANWGQLRRDIYFCSVNASAVF